MNTHLFSKFIISLGFAILLVAGFVTSEATKEREQASADVSEQVGKRLKVGLPVSYVSDDLMYGLSAGRAADEKYTKGVYVGIAGGLVLFLGVALMLASSPKPQARARMSDEHP